MSYNLLLSMLCNQWKVVWNSIKLDFHVQKTKNILLSQTKLFDRQKYRSYSTSSNSSGSKKSVSFDSSSSSTSLRKDSYFELFGGLNMSKWNIIEVIRIQNICCCLVTLLWTPVSSRLVPRQSYSIFLHWWPLLILVR